MRQITITEGDDGVLTFMPVGDITWMKVVALLEWGKFQACMAWNTDRAEESVLPDKGEVDDVLLDTFDHAVPYKGFMKKSG